MRKALSKVFSKRFFSNIDLERILGLMLSFIDAICLILFFIMVVSGLYYVLF